MKKKYYYDCPIQALYMHVNFGVKFPTELKFIADLSTDNFSENMTPDITKIYVKPESEHIFQPREGDIGIYQKQVNVIYRDSKHFFMPKEEINMKNKNYEIIKKQITKANKYFWQQKALEMLVFPHADEGYTICGEKCTKQEAIESFEKYSGYTLNELGIKHD